jgi:hypothetical protein
MKLTELYVTKIKFLTTTHCFPFLKNTVLLMQFRETIAVYSDNKQARNMLCGETRDVSVMLKQKIRTVRTVI